MTDDGWTPERAAQVAADAARRLWWVIVAVLAAGLYLFVLRGADEPADPFVVDRSSGSQEVSPSGQPVIIPQGFASSVITVKLADGSEVQWCVLVAETEAQRARGLMTVTDPELGGFDGMLFRYDLDGEGSFYMRNTPMPLSIAFLSATGSLVSAADMTPCADVDNCPLYAAGAPYRSALEVPQGGLEELGIVPGSIVVDTKVPCSPS